MNTTNALGIRVDKGLDGARVLWKPWTAANSEAREGYVREFSPTGLQVRISYTPATEDRGQWYECAGIRCVEVLDERFDYSVIKAAEEKKRRRPREDGEEWKDGAE